MEGTAIFPSPNWFQVSVLAVSKDDWLVYGGPSKSICVLEPLNSINQGKENIFYQVHVVNKAHSEKITSVDISWDWPEKKIFLTGSADGCVKQWSFENVQNMTRMKSTHCLDIHQNENEDVAGVGYSSDPFAITVGIYGNIVKWDLKSNVAKTYNKFLKKFNPTCMACSHHVPLTVAVGTKQGVIFVLDLNGEGNIVYKVRGQDDEIVNVSWCPQYDVLLQKSLRQSFAKSNAMERCVSDSAVTKNLLDDSCDESVVQEDEPFDIYKDHEADKNYETKVIMVKFKDKKKTDDYLAECVKLKDDILNLNNDSESSVANLVEALDKTHADSDTAENSAAPSSGNKEKAIETIDIASVRIQKHLLATIGKLGDVRIWSKTGKQVGSFVAPNYTMKNNKNKGPHSSTLLWYKPEVLLLVDGKSQLVECNPLAIDCKNKIQWRVVHALHKRGLYCIASNAPRLQRMLRASDSSPDRYGGYTPDQWKIWTIAQDRNLICYSLEKHEKIAIYNTCGGFLYTLQTCPYDAKRIAISVGDGAVRVWDFDISDDDDSTLALGHVTSYWQNVQGKVLTVAWHPTRVNLIAFSTAEARVGLIDAHSKIERPAKTLVPALQSAIYSLCWGDGYNLYVAGGGKLVMYHADKLDEDPVPINVEFEGLKWELSLVNWYPTGLLCGSNSGAVALLDPYTRKVLTVAFVFSKMIHSLEWHPQQISSSCEESPYKNLIAVSSLDKSHEIAILEYVDKGDGPKLHKVKTLNGHKHVVLQVQWNPHKDAQLLSTSHDSTIRVWDVSESVCIAIYGGHIQSSLGAVWSAFPQLSSTILSGGADCCLRVWKVEDYPPEAYKEIKHETAPKKEKKKKVKTEENEEEIIEVDEGQKATNFERKLKVPRLFLLPTIRKRMLSCSVQGLKIMAEKFINSENQENIGELKSADNKIKDTNDILKPEEATEKNVANSEEIKDNIEFENIEIESNDDFNDEEIETNTYEVKGGANIYVDFLKIFGTTNDLNEVLDLEMHRHIKHRRIEAWIMLSIFRGHIESMIQYASQRDALCPFLVSISPCVSLKYWKDVTQLYLVQIERQVAKGEEYKIGENKSYGGSIYRRVALMLSVHDVKGAVNALVDARLFSEAYVLAKARHMDSIAQETLQTWAVNCVSVGQTDMGALCYLALGDPHKAAVTLANSNDQEYLSVAAGLAKTAGQSTFATHIEDKKSTIPIETPETDVTEDLEPLPSKIDVLKHNMEIE